MTTSGLYRKHFRLQTLPVNGESIEEFTAVVATGSRGSVLVRWAEIAQLR